MTSALVWGYIALAIGWVILIAALIATRPRINGVTAAVKIAGRPVDPHPDWTLSGAGGSVPAHDSTVPGAAVEGDSGGTTR